METAELKGQIEKQLKTLRSADSQKEAVAWMTSAYRLMEECLGHLSAPKEIEVIRFREKLVYVPERPKLQVVQSLPRIQMHSICPPVWSRGPTIVYPEVPMSPPQRKAWTHKDTLKLENAMKFSRAQLKIQKRSR